MVLRKQSVAALLGVVAALLVAPAMPAGGQPAVGDYEVAVNVPTPPGQSGWAATAVQFRGKNGARYVYSCPAGGGARTIWGTDLYTDDSSVCTAAVHAGRITLARGGTVTVEIRAGQASYRGSARRGITSRAYGRWPGSYVIVAGTTAPTVSGWPTTATANRGRVAQRFSYTCPTSGALGPVWGTDLYTDDSSICTAAVHAGRITAARGGTVVIEMRAGQRSYRATTRNGVASRAYGAWPGSFVIVKATPLPVPTTTTPPTTTPAVEFGGDSWAAAAQNLRSRVGTNFRYTCPPGGPARTAWGVDVYTDDSSVCTAAVHAGRITVAAGGTVIIQIRPGQASYAGSTRNGITTSPYDAWGGSFVFV